MVVSPTPREERFLYCRHSFFFSCLSLHTIGGEEQEDYVHSVLQLRQSDNGWRAAATEKLDHYHACPPVSLIEATMHHAGRRTLHLSGTVRVPESGAAQTRQRIEAYCS